MASSPDREVDSPPFPRRQEMLFGRGQCLKQLQARAGVAGALTAVYGCPMMGKSWVLLELCRSLEEARYLVGYYDSHGEANDSLLRGVSDLYVRWLRQASKRAQFKSIIRQKKGEFIGVVGQAILDLLKEAEAVPALKFPGLVRKLLEGLVATNQQVKSGGFELKKLSYEQARGMVAHLVAIEGRPVVLVLDSWEKSGLSQVDYEVLDGYLRNPDDWPKTHIFLGVRADNLEQPIGQVLQSLSDYAEAELCELGEIDLRDPAEQDRLVAFLRTRIPVARKVTDRKLLGLIEGYPRVVNFWLGRTPPPATWRELARIASDAKALRYKHLERTLAGLSLAERQMAARLVLLPEISSAEDWGAYKEIVWEGRKIRKEYTNLRDKGILDGQMIYAPSFGHSTRYTAAQTWMLTEGKVAEVTQQEAEYLFDRLAVRIRDAEPGVRPFAEALSSLASASEQATGWPPEQRLIARAARCLLDWELGPWLVSPASLEETADALVQAARRFPQGAVIVAIALVSRVNRAFYEGNVHAIDLLLDRMETVASFRPDHLIRRWLAKGYYRRAFTYYNQARWREALADFERVCQLDAARGDYAELRIWAASARLDGPKLANVRLRAFATRRPDRLKHDWVGTVSGFLLGEVSSANLARAAVSKDPGERREHEAERFWFTALKSLVEGDAASAWEAFLDCFRVSHFDYFEHLNAWKELGALSPPQPARVASLTRNAGTLSLIDSRVASLIESNRFPDQWSQRVRYVGEEGASAWLKTTSHPSYESDHLNQTLRGLLVEAASHMERGTMVSLGSGDAETDRYIVNARGASVESYIPVDIADGLLHRAVDRLARLVRVPAAIWGDFEHGLDFIIPAARMQATSPLLIAMLGGTMGNLDGRETRFLGQLQSLMKAEDAFMFDVSLKGADWSLIRDRRGTHSGYSPAYQQFLALGISRHTGETVGSVTADFDSRISIKEEEGQSDVPGCSTIVIRDHKSGLVVSSIRRYDWDTFLPWLNSFAGFRVAFGKEVYSSPTLGDGVILLRRG